MRLDRIHRDYWRFGIVAAPIAAALDPAAFAAAPIIWGPTRGGDSYSADPFGFVHDGRLTVFVEHYDYHARHGTIAAYQYDAQLHLCETREVLREPWHLSYPLVFAHGGAIFMLPEQCRGGSLILYRASDYPWRWERHAVLMEQPLVDASLFQHEGRWWILASPKGRMEASVLLAFFADDLMGPYHAHPGNPLLIDRGRARPAGTPFVADGALYYPAMDCRGTYGKAVVINRLDQLTPKAFSSSPAARLEAASWGVAENAGLHTLATAGPQHSLIDLKRRVFSPMEGVNRTLARLRRSS